MFLLSTIESMEQFDWNMGDADDELVKQAYKFFIMVTFSFPSKLSNKSLGKCQVC